MSATITKIQSNNAEAELMDLIRQGNKQAFSDLYDRYAPALLGLILKMTADAEKAEDILQAAFIKVTDPAVSNTHSGERLFTRILKIARVLAITSANTGQGEAAEIHLRKHLVDANNDRHYSANTVAGTYSSQSGLVTDQQHNSLNLVCFKGQSYAETAEQQGLSVPELKISIREELKRWRK